MLTKLFNFTGHIPFLLYMIPRILIGDVYNTLKRVYLVSRPYLSSIGITYMIEDIIDYLRFYPVLFSRNLKMKFGLFRYLRDRLVGNIRQIPKSPAGALLYVLRSDAYFALISLIMAILMSYVIFLAINLDVEALELPPHPIQPNNSDLLDSSCLTKKTLDAHYCTSGKATDSNRVPDEDDVETTDETSEVSVQNSTVLGGTWAGGTSDRLPPTPRSRLPPSPRANVPSSNSESKTKKGGVRLDLSVNTYQPSDRAPLHSPVPPTAPRPAFPRGSILKNSPPRGSLSARSSNSSSTESGSGIANTAELVEQNTDLNSMNTLQLLQKQHSRRSTGGGGGSSGGSDDSSTGGLHRMEYIHSLSPRQNLQLEEQILGTPYARASQLSASGAAASEGKRKLLIGIGELAGDGGGGAGSSRGSVQSGSITGSDSSSEDDDDEDLEETRSRTSSVHSEHSVMSVHSVRSAGDEHISTEKVIIDSVENPKVLIGWRIMVKGYGTGLVLSLKKQRFSTTKFNIQLESGARVTLPLKRSARKGTVPFTLIGKLV